MNFRDALRRLNPKRLGNLFKSQEEIDLTSGSIGWPLFYLSLPIVVTNLLQTAYNLADTFWLGQLSREALAAITFAFPMVFLFISLGLGLTVAGSVLVAQHIGAGEEEEATYAASQTMTFALVMSIVLGAVGFVVVEDVFRLLGVGPDVLPAATAYMEIVSLGLFMMFGFFVFISLMRGYGDTITPMLVMLGTVVLNIALDPFLIFGWGPFPAMGVEGAAVATVFSRGLAMLVGLYIMLEGSRGVQIRIRDMWPDLSYLRRLFRIGAPASVEGTGRALSINLLLVVVATFPQAVEAAFGVGIRVFSVIFLPAIAVGRGVETLAGQNIGASKEDRAALTSAFAAKVMFVVLSVAAVLVWVTAPSIMAVFNDDPQVISVGTDFLRIVAPTFGFTGVMRAYSGGFRGAGKTMIAATIAIFTQGIVRLPVAWFAVIEFDFGTTGLFASFVVSNILGAVIAFAWYRRGTWRGADLTDDPTATVSPSGVEDEATVDD
jgi:putative MATE family efflux protein